MDKNNIIKVIVAEDESLLLKNTIRKIEEISPSFQVVGSAYNGQEALELLATTHPHILLTDIKMPRIDGLELIRQTREQYPHVQIIIISGYEDFEYARKAIQYGVVDYLTKPVKAKLLQDTLLKLQNTIQARQLSVQRTVLTSRLLGQQTAAPLPFDFSHKHFMIFLLCFGNLPNRFMNEHSSFDCPFTQILNDCISPTETWWLIDEKIINQKFLILCTDDTDERKIIALAEKLQTASSKFPTFPVLTISLCEQFIPLSDLWNRAQHLRTFLYQGLVIGHRQIITMNCIKNADLTCMNTLYSNKFRTFANSGNAAAFIQLLETLLFEMDTNHCPQYLIEKAMSELLDILRSAAIIPEVTFHSVECHVYEFIFHSHTLLVFCENILILMRELFEKNVQQNSQLFHILDEVEDYFTNNYTENINLDNVAKHYGFNTSYLARNFKKYKGESPMKYILKLRIEAAKLLLTNHPELSIKEISELVGYSDQHYFSRFFKEMTGVPPSEYR